MKRLLTFVVFGALLVGGVYWLVDQGSRLPTELSWLHHGAVRMTAEMGQVVKGVGWPAEAAASRRPAQYVTALVERGDIRQTVTTTGTLKALVTVEVGTQLSGQIATLFADFNDEVKKGQSLAQLDQRSYNTRLAEAAAAAKMAEAVVEMEKAKLERARINTEDAEAQRAILEAQLENAQIRLDSAQSALERSEKLKQRGAMSGTQVEEALTARKLAAANLREAEAVAAAHDYEVAGANADSRRAEAELAHALASVPQKQAAQRSAQIDLERTTIRSPIDGVVVGRNINEGQTVAASLEAPTLFTIVGDLRQMEIHARVDESDIGKIRIGQTATFAVDAYPDRHFSAVVAGVRKAPEVLQNVVTYTVVLATTNEDALLLPGMTAVVRITVSELDEVLNVPLAALRFSPAVEASVDASEPAEVPESRSGIVWLTGVSAKLRPVALGLGEDDGSHIAVLHGELEEGDQIIVGEVMEPETRQFFGIRLGF